MVSPNRMTELSFMINSFYRNKKCPDLVAMWDRGKHDFANNSDDEVAGKLSEFLTDDQPEKFVELFSTLKAKTKCLSQASRIVGYTPRITPSGYLYSSLLV